ncbi:hypothetical protein DL93DRAFT_2169886 [Clavulina sp. PMI_390]|nr:hypothetical protein DL93DRAFT_2169886 [Clavulina sp. PMI_390]
MSSSRAEENRQPNWDDDEARPFFLSPYHAVTICVPLTFGVTKTVLNIRGESLIPNTLDIFLSFVTVILYVLWLAEPSLRHPFWLWLFRFNLWASFYSALSSWKAKIIRVRNLMPRNVVTVFRRMDPYMFGIGMLLPFISMIIQASLWLSHTEATPALTQTIISLRMIGGIILIIRSIMSV